MKPSDNMYNWNKLDFIDLIISMPDKDLCFPRDNSFINNSLDILFLSKLIANWGKRIKWLNLYENEKIFFYFYENAFGEILYPLSGMPVVNIQVYNLKKKMKKSTVRKNIKNFFSFRRLLSDKVDTDWYVYVSSVAVFDKGIFIKENFDKINSSLEWKIREDELSDQLLSAKMFDFDFGSFDGHDFYVICPVDGPVKPIEGDVITSNESWRGLFGRHWKVLLCPCCLGKFREVLYKMN